MQKKQNSFGLNFWKLALNLITGGVMLVIGFLVSDIPKMILSQGWLTTDGKIIHHRFVGQKFKEYDGDFYEKIDVYIRYKYSVDDISYISLSINSIDTPFYPSSYANRYPVGENVIVYYNPENPADAVLEPGFVDISKAFGGFSILTFIAGVFFITLGLSGIKKIRYQNYVSALIEKHKNQ